MKRKQLSALMAERAHRDIEIQKSLEVGFCDNFTGSFSNLSVDPLICVDKRFSSLQDDDFWGDWVWIRGKDGVEAGRGAQGWDEGCAAAPGVPRGSKNGPSSCRVFVAAGYIETGSRGIIFGTVLGSTFRTQNLVRFSVSLKETL